MKDTIKLLPLLLLVAGCTNGKMSPEQSKVLFASTPASSETKTAINEDRTITWTKGDYFLAFGNDNPTLSDTYILSDGTGTAQGTFTSDGTKVTTPTDAIYPSYSVNGNTVTVEIKQTYNNCQYIHHIPMHGEITGDKVSFRPMMAVVKLAIDRKWFDQNKKDFAMIEFVAKGKKISGNLEVDMTTMSIPVKAAGTPNNTIAVAKEANTNVYYFPLPSGDFGEIRVNLKSAGKNKFQRIFSKNMRTEAGKMYTLNIDSFKSIQ